MATLKLFLEPALRLLLSPLWSPCSTLCGTHHSLSYLALNRTLLTRSHPKNISFIYNRLCRLARKLPVVGNINAFLYKAWAMNPNAFTDIVQGDPQDQGCCAANFATVPGWVRNIHIRLHVCWYMVDRILTLAWALLTGEFSPISWWATKCS